MQASAQPIVLILNNGIYGTIRAQQERNYPTRVSGTTIDNPDFVTLARSYGFHAERVGATKDFVTAFGRALNSATGAVLDIAISPEALTPRQTLSQMREFALASQKAKA
jgi:acetolactate synthase-1/2/3 large subunit